MTNTASTTAVPSDTPSLPACAAAATRARLAASPPAARGIRKKTGTGSRGAVRAQPPPAVDLPLLEALLEDVLSDGPETSPLPSPEPLTVLDAPGLQLPGSEHLLLSGLFQGTELSPPAKLTCHLPHAPHADLHMQQFADPMGPTDVLMAASFDQPVQQAAAWQRLSGNAGAEPRGLASSSAAAGVLRIGCGRANCPVNCGDCFTQGLQQLSMRRFGCKLRQMPIKARLGVVSLLLS